MAAFVIKSWKKEFEIQDLLTLKSFLQTFFIFGFGNVNIFPNKTFFSTFFDWIFLKNVEKFPVLIVKLFCKS